MRLLLEVVGIVFLIVSCLLLIFPMVKKSFVEDVIELKDNTTLDTRYNEKLYAVSHNSFSTYTSNYWYAQQSMSITDQLNYGIRGLMLDIYNLGDKVVLAHGGNDVNMLLRYPVGFWNTLLFDNAMEEIVQWLNDNPSEILTIFLEDYVSSTSGGKEKLDNVLEKYENLIYNAPIKDGIWPRISTMVEINKRIIFFSDHSSTKYCYKMWEHVNENEFSTVEYPYLCIERGQSRRSSHGKRTLSLINIFPEAPFEKNQPLESYKKRRSDITNAKSNIQKVYDCTKARTGQNPTFISVDFVEKGDLIEFVNNKNSS